MNGNLKTIGISILAYLSKESLRIHLFHIAMVFLITAVFVAIAEYKADNPNQLAWLNTDQRGCLGFIHDEIALSLRAGKGFCVAVDNESKSTAWMPPILPYLMAAAYWYYDDDRSKVIDLFVVLQALLAAINGILVVDCARRLRIVGIGYVIIICGFYVDFFELFQRTYDMSLLTPIVISLYQMNVTITRKGMGFWRSLMFGILGGICFLGSPVLGCTWGFSLILSCVCRRRFCNPTKCGTKSKSLGSLHRWWRTRQVRPRDIYKDTFHLAFLISFLVISPWVLRNRLVLGKWIPIKSNSMFELWQSHCNDDDGILDSQSGSGHPILGKGEQHKRFALLGELGYLEEKSKVVKASIFEHPEVFCIHVVNRFIAAFIYYFPVDLREEKAGNGWPILIKRLLFPLPFLSLLAILALRTKPLETEITSAMIVWTISILPYVMISYYERYGTPLFGLKMLVILYGLNTLMNVRRSS